MRVCDVVGPQAGVHDDDVQVVSLQGVVIHRGHDCRRNHVDGLLNHAYREQETAACSHTHLP